jgi:RasGEF domain
VIAYSPSVGILFNYSNKEIAAALTELEKQIYSLIRPADYILYLRRTPISDHVTASQLFTLKIRVWVTQTLLSYEQVLERSRVFEFFLRTAKVSHIILYNSG